MVSALAGLGGLFALYEAGEHGGELVYSYASGIGPPLRYPADVHRPLVAGLYNAGLAARAPDDPSA